MRGPALVVRLAALSGFLAVAFGAFAAHGARDARAAELLHTGSLYQMTHALAVFGWLAVRSSQDGAGGKVGLTAPALFLVGTVLFSGSLYALAFGAPRIAGHGHAVRRPVLPGRLAAAGLARRRSWTANRNDRGSR
jgi:uncharacterized membrane protein YgdD (TMEM256/DUF423 family)